MCEATSEQIFLLRSEIQQRRFTDENLRILESILVSRDVRCLIATRSAVKDLLRSESFCALREISDKSLEQKLNVVEFFVKAFALVGDVESCLVLKYEALVLRDRKHFSDDSLRVSHEEWLQFGKDSLDNGFYKIAIKGFESAIASIHCNADIEQEQDYDDMLKHVIGEAKQLRDVSASLLSSRSVKAQAAGYLKRRANLAEEVSSLSSKTNDVASLIFRRGIKQRNFRKLCHSQRM